MSEFFYTCNFYKVKVSGVRLVSREEEERPIGCPVHKNTPSYNKNSGVYYLSQLIAGFFLVSWRQGSSSNSEVVAGRAY